MDELDQIQQQIAELQQKAQKLHQQKKSAVLEEVKAKIKAYGLTAKECGFSTTEKNTGDRRSLPVTIKYRDGENTWTGRGRKPKWLEKKLATGSNLKDFAV
ncbi:MAG: H-NS histone family protein [Thiobacillus sp.]|jgi:DNA-binding protein H-NS|uniref:H-NS histone family protein n=1 Tax=Thiobacillus sp. TaxID=924 RepID=UPI002893E5A5|nr:H-NS histone family protein [Thiobacillus sp.]MDT3707549.1 H-NS histone family protein [Thiobacillus sp.]